MIQSTILADTINKDIRVTSFRLTFPRYILSEVNTHRKFSRNSASSRAIPTRKNLEMVKTSPYIPTVWIKDHSGMQGKEVFHPAESEILKSVWLEARDQAVEKAEKLFDLGVSKQIVNRLLEPFMWHTIILTGSQWDNFFEQRCSKFSKNYNLEYSIYDKNTQDFLLSSSGAEINFQILANSIKNNLENSVPKESLWHIPYRNEVFSDSFDEMILASAAMCARVSYTQFDKDIIGNKTKNLELAKRLIEEGHWSPFEHVVKMEEPKNDKYVGNLKGVTQLRHLIENDKENYLKIINELCEI